MGIEARCPNGHDVRVKDRFAGKKAYCPECGATFRVPLPKSRSSDAHATETPELPVATIVSLDGDYAASLPRATALGTLEAADPVASTEAPAVGRREPRAPVTPAVAAEPPPEEIPVERRFHPVIAEATDVEWNVALPGGDPSEPLSADMLQEWLDAGGATGSELVWRQDWPDWVPIRLVFPEHVPPSAG
jgi:hypothetical protein